MWNQWGPQASAASGFQAAAYPPAPGGSNTTAPPPGGFPMGYPFYPTSGMPPSAAAMPGYTTGPQQWSMPQQQQWQQWEQWQQQYSQWQQQYGDKYQAQMMMGGGAGIPPLPAQGDSSANPPLPTDLKAQLTKEADGSSGNLAYNQGVVQLDLSAKRPHDNSSEDTSGSQQTPKKARESQEEPSEAEKAFDTQFKNWEEQFLKWKEQNSNHPDKNQYKEYEAKWESWREQLMQRREQMRKKRELKQADDSKALSSVNESTQSDQKPSPSASLASHAQKQMPPVSMQTPNPNSLAMQGMAFPPFSNPPPMVQNPMVQPVMGFPNFGNQHYPSFPSQPPGYGMPPAPFQAQPMFPGMNMMCPPPAIIPNAPDLLSSTSVSQRQIKKDSTQSASQADKSHDNHNFLNKSEGSNKGIPGLDLVEGGASGRDSDDKINQAPPRQLPLNTGPLHTSDDNTPFNFPPPQKPQMGFPGSTGPSGLGFGPGNMPFMGSQAFGPPPGFGSNVRGSFPGSFNQSPQKFGPNTTQGPPPQIGKNFQLPRPFFDQDKGQQSFSQPGIPNLMDGFDPSKGPPSFSKKYEGNQKDGDQDKNENDYKDQGEDDYNDYDEYDGSRFENPWDREQDNYDDENNDDKFKEPSDLNKPFGNRTDGPSNFNKASDRFGLKPDLPFGGGFNRSSDRFSDSNVPKDMYGLQGSGSRFDRFPSESNVKDMDDRSSRFSGPSDGLGGRAFGGRENKVSRFGPPFEEKRFGGSRFDSPRDQDLDSSEGSRDKKIGFGKQNDPEDRFGRGKFSNQNKGFPGAKENPDRFPGHFDGPGDRFGGPSNRFGGPDDRFSGRGSLDAPRGFDNSRGGRFNGPDKFPSGGRGPRDFDSSGDRFEDVGPGFGGDRFGGRKDKPFGRDENEPGNQGRAKGLLPHPTMDRDKIPSLMSLGKPPLLPIPGRGGGPGPKDAPEEKFPSGKPDLDDRRPEVPGVIGGRRNEPVTPLIPAKEGSSSGILPQFPQEVKKELNPTVIDYDHKSSGEDLVFGDLNEPESLEPIQVYDYNHGANPGPLMPHQRRDFLEEGDDWRSDRGPRNRDRGRDDRDKPGSRGRNWEDDRSRQRDRDRNDDRSRDRDWGKRSERDDKRDRDRNERDRDRDRDDKRDKDRDRDRSDRDRSDRRDGRRDDKDKENRSSGQTDRRGGPRDRNQHDSKSKDDNKFSSRNERSSTKEDDVPQKSSVDQKQQQQQSPAVLIEDILNNPGRNNRPAKIVVILRGPPGSGKTYVAKLIKDKEVEMGGSAPRILSLDDYFMVEIEKEETDPESGRTVKNKIMEYEFESGMESSYRHSLIKAFRKTILDGYFPFIIIDCVHEKIQHYEEINTFAKQKGFQVYICEMDKDLSSCSKRNIHKRTEKEIEVIIKNWEPTPPTQTILDVRSLLQSAAITEVDMEDTTEETNTEDKKEDENKKDETVEKTDEKSGEEKDGNEAEGDRALFTSKWDTMEFSGEKLDRLDGLAKARKTNDTIRDWLQLPEDYYELSGSNVSSKSGKRVRWADLEERRQQEKMRAIGFVVGQTDWSRMMDPSYGVDKLTQTKYI